MIVKTHRFKAHGFKPLAGAAFMLGIAVLASAQKQTVRSPLPVSTRFDAPQLLQDLRVLSADSMEGRASGSRGAAKARQWVLKRFKESGLAPVGTSYFQNFKIASRRSGISVPGVNILGGIKGKKYPNKYIVVTAHYDHLGIRDGKIYNGADDNASGTAALFALANYFSHHLPDHSLLFVAFDGEEIGLVGSQYFVANLPISKKSILLDINMDMISRNEKNELYASGTFQNPSLKSVLEKVKKQAPINLLLGHDDPKTGHDDWTTQSDQGSFYDVGIAALYFGVEDHKDYHQPTDDFENIDPKFYSGATETVLSVVDAFDKSLK